MLVADGGATTGNDRGRKQGQLWTLSIVERRADNEAILLLKGRLGHKTAPAFETAAGRLLADDVSKVVVDLSGVDYLSSAALGAIERLALGLTAAGRILSLRNPTVPVRLALELSGGLVDHIESTPA